MGLIYKVKKFVYYYNNGLFAESVTLFANLSISQIDEIC